MTTTSRVNNVTTPSREFRLDSLSLCRLNWLQSFFNAHEWKPSGSVVVRRALAHYLDHVENLMDDEEGFQSELFRIKAHRNNDRSPFGESRGFDGRSFSDMLKEARKYAHCLGNPLSKPDPAKRGEWERIWEKLDRGEKP